MVYQFEPASGGISQPEFPERRRGRWQMSLAGLISLVLAAGVTAAVVRSAREVWGERVARSVRPPSSGMAPTTVPVPIERTAGLVLEVAAVFLILILARSLFGLDRGLPAATAVHGNILGWARFWRALAIGFLFWFISQESFLLRFDLQTEREYAASIPALGEIYEVRQNLFPICALMAMIGLMLGAGAGSFLDQPQPPRRRLPSLFAVLASLAGVLIMAKWDYHTRIPYLILNALEAVTNAMQHRLVPGPSLSARLITAGIHAGVSCIACAALAVVLACDFDRARRGVPWGATRAAWFLRIGYLALAAALGLHVALVTIPGIHANLAEGFRSILGRTELGMIVCGFGLSAAGMAARSLFPRPAEERPIWLARVAAGIRWTILGIAILWFLINASSSAPPDPGMPRVVGLVYVISQWIARMWDVFSAAFVTDLFSVFTVNNVLWITLGLGMVMLLFELAIRPAAAGGAPFDKLATQPAIAWRFLWLVIGLVVVCVAALPTLFVAGQALLHARLFAGDLWANGWPR